MRLGSGGWCSPCSSQEVEAVRWESRESHALEAGDSRRNEEVMPEAEQSSAGTDQVVRLRWTPTLHFQVSSEMWRSSVEPRPGVPGSGFVAGEFWNSNLPGRAGQKVGPDSTASTTYLDWFFLLVPYLPYLGGRLAFHSNVSLRVLRKTTRIALHVNQSPIVNGTTLNPGKRPDCLCFRSAAVVTTSFVSLVSQVVRGGRPRSEALRRFIPRRDPLLQMTPPIRDLDVPRP